MPTFYQRPAPPVRPGFRLGWSAAGLLLVIGTATDPALARERPVFVRPFCERPVSLPYLLQTPPRSLRLVPEPARLPPPPPLTLPDLTSPTVEHSPTDSDSPKSENDSTASPTPSAETTAATNPAPPSIPNASNDSPVAPPPPTGTRLLPDTYAPLIPVRVEDILPYLRPRSQATYELK